MNISSYKSIYFLGIGGISMSALAQILKRRGKTVAGYDAVRSNEVGLLEAAGIPVCFDESSISLDGFDAVVYTAALTPSHPAMQAAERSGLPIFSRAELLGAIASEYDISVGVAGTHGKSTSSGMLARIYEENGGSTYIVGAVLPFVGSTYRLGDDNRLVFEACEYRDSFLSFHPSLAVVLNVKLDHTDYFPSLDAMRASFEKYINGASAALVNADDDNAMLAARSSHGRVYTFSLSKPADYTALYDDTKQGLPEFDIAEQGAKVAHVTLSVPGRHNVYNALAAFAAARLTGVDVQTAVRGLEGFYGVGRRFERIELDQSHGRFYLDYAHHPDELAATIAAAKKISDGKITAVFQPHTYSRLRDFFDGFASSLAAADRVIVTDVYAAREQNDGTVSGSMLASAIGGAEYMPSFEAIADDLLEKSGKNDTILILGAGDIAQLADILKRKQKTT